MSLGCRQKNGVAYNEIFSPVVTTTTIRAIVDFTAYHDVELEQIDVATAFFNCNLEEDIYMKVPEGLKTRATENKVTKLEESLYELKQSPRQW